MASKLLEILFVLSIYNIIFFLSPSWVRRLLQRRLRLKVRKYIEMTIKLKVAAAASFYTGFVFSFLMYELIFFFLFLPIPSSILNFMVRTATMCNNNNNYQMLAKYL